MISILLEMFFVIECGSNRVDSDSIDKNTKRLLYYYLKSYYEEIFKNFIMSWLPKKIQF